MNHLSLFNGIGGFQLAAKWVGWNNVAHVEIDPSCNKVVAYHFPESQCFTDIKQFDGKQFAGTIDIISGGFPCQPYSLAGKRKGKEDDRHLWPEMLRVIREIQPGYIVGENVYGLINWNGGLVFHEVQSELEAEGYEVWPVILPACAVNAPHRRDRVWFIAYSNRNGESTIAINESKGQWKLWTTTNADQKRLSKEGRSTKMGWFGFSKHDAQNYKSAWENFPTQSPICSGNDGISARLDGITFSKWRNESIKAAGNAIVPQVALEIFKVIDLLSK